MHIKSTVQQVVRKKQGPSGESCVQLFCIRVEESNCGEDKVSARTSAGLLNTTALKRRTGDQAIGNEIFVSSFILRVPLPSAIALVRSYTPDANWMWADVSRRP